MAADSSAADVGQRSVSSENSSTDVPYCSIMDHAVTSGNEETGEEEVLYEAADTAYPADPSLSDTQLTAVPSSPLAPSHHPVSSTETKCGPAEGVTLIIGDDNFTFTPCFLDSRHYNPSLGPVEVASCLSEDKIPNDYRPNYLALASQGITIHFGINPAQLRNHFFHNQFSRIIFILPGIAFSGFPSFLDKHLDPLFRLRLHIYAFGFLKSSKNALKPNALIQFLWPRQTERNTLSPAVPWHSIEIGKIGPFCEVFRSEEDEEVLEASSFHDWHPLIHNEPQTQFPTYLHDCVFYTWRLNPVSPSGTAEASLAGNSSPSAPGNQPKPSTTSTKASEDKDSNLLFVPPELWNYSVETLPHVNDLFKFEMKTHDGGLMVVSKPTLKFDPRFRSDGAPAKNPFAKGGGPGGPRGSRRQRGGQLDVNARPPFCCPPPPPPPECPVSLLPCGGFSGGPIIAPGLYGYGDVNSMQSTMIPVTAEPPRWMVPAHRGIWDIEERQYFPDGSAAAALELPQNALTALHYGQAADPLGGAAARVKRSRLEDETSRYLAEVQQRYHDYSVAYGNPHYGKEASPHMAYMKTDPAKAVEASHDDVLLYESMEQHQYDYRPATAGYEPGSVAEYSRRCTATPRARSNSFVAPTTGNHSQFTEPRRSSTVITDNLDFSFHRDGASVSRASHECYAGSSACVADSTAQYEADASASEASHHAPPPPPPLSYTDREPVFHHQQHTRESHEPVSVSSDVVPHQHRYHHERSEGSQHHDGLYHERDDNYSHRPAVNNPSAASSSAPHRAPISRTTRQNRSGYDSSTSTPKDGSPGRAEDDNLRSLDRVHQQRHYQHQDTHREIRHEADHSKTSCYHYHQRRMHSVAASGSGYRNSPAPAISDCFSGRKQDGSPYENEHPPNFYINSHTRGAPSVLHHESSDGVFERRHGRSVSPHFYDAYPSPQHHAYKERPSTMVVSRRGALPRDESSPYALRPGGRHTRNEMSHRPSVSPDAAGVYHRNRPLAHDVSPRRRERLRTNNFDDPGHYSSQRYQWSYEADMPSPDARNVPRRSHPHPRELQRRPGASGCSPEPRGRRAASPLVPFREATDRQYADAGVADGQYPRKITLVSPQHFRGGVAPRNGAGYPPLRSRGVRGGPRRSGTPEQFSVHPRRAGS